MATTQNTTDGRDDLTESLVRFYRTYYREDLSRLARHYPREQHALHIEFGDLWQHDRELAEDWLDTSGP